MRFTFTEIYEIYIYRNFRDLHLQKFHFAFCQNLRDLQIIMFPLVRCAAYDVQVTTGNVSNAGTDANVFITLHGPNGTTTKTKLKNQSRNSFEKGKTDVFTIEVEDVGEISSIR